MDTIKTVNPELNGNYQIDIFKPSTQIVDGEKVQNNELIGFVKLNHLSIDNVCMVNAIYKACIDENKTVRECYIEIGKFMMETVVTEYSELFDEPENVFKKINMYDAIVDKGYFNNIEESYISKKKE